ncbi:MAG: hypothetical protein RR248_01525 [Clostridia bacterium]
MKLLKVVTTNPTNKEVINFSFGDATATDKLIYTRNSRLERLIEGAFLVNKFLEEIDISIDFAINQTKYNLKRTVSEQKNIHTSLRLLGDKISVVAKDGKITEYLEKELGGSLKEVISDCFASATEFRNFVQKNDISSFAQIQKLLDVSSAIESTYISTKQKGDVAREQAKKLYPQFKAVGQQEVEMSAQRLFDKQKTLIALFQQQAQLKGRLNDPVLIRARAELDSCRASYETLLNEKDAVELRRRQLSQYNSIKQITPKLSQYEQLNKEIKEHTEKRFSIVKEIDWHEDQAREIEEQLSQKQRQVENAISSRTKIELVQEDLEHIRALEDDNNELTQALSKLQMQEDRYVSNRLDHKNSLANIETAIEELKAEVEATSLPARPMSELAESLKISVKIDEIENQMEKIRGEIAIKQGISNEQERALTIQTKQLKNVLALDATVAPLKARDVIIQVVDKKIKKLDMINSSLKQKEINLARALEEENYDLFQIENSCGTISTEIHKSRYAKGEEFKREVLINSQKLYQDVTSVYATDVNLEDQTITQQEDTLNKRIYDKADIQSTIARIEGKLEEIKRFIDINDAEIASLNQQKENIIARYNQLISENSNESVYNYLRALEADKGTKYLLDVSQETVRAETQNQELKRYIDSLKAKLTDLEARHSNLSNTQEALHGESALDLLIGANEQTKTELTDAITRLNALYEKHKAIQQKIDDADIKLMQVKELMLETTKTIKINQKDISQIRTKAQELAGGDIESVLAESEYLKSDLEAEEKLLSVSRTQTQKELFARRVEIVKLEWQIEQKKVQAEQIKSELKASLIANSIKPEFAESVVALSGQNIDDIAKSISDYDEMHKQLSYAIDRLSKIVLIAPSGEDEKQLAKLYATQETQIESVATEITELQKQYDITLKECLESARQRNELVTLSNQIGTISSLESSLESSKVINIIIKDKIRGFVNDANAYLAVMDSTLSLSYTNQLSVYVNETITQLTNLTPTQQLLVFLALEIALPTSSNVKGSWLIVDEKIECDKNLLSQALLKINNINFVCGYQYKKPKENKNVD